MSTETPTEWWARRQRKNPHPFLCVLSTEDYANVDIADSIGDNRSIVLKRRERTFAFKRQNDRDMFALVTGARVLPDYQEEKRHG